RPTPTRQPDMTAATDQRAGPRAALLAAIGTLRPALAEVHDDDSLRSLGLDSLDRLVLAAVLERATGYPTSDRALAEARTVAALLTCTTADLPVPTRTPAVGQTVTHGASSPARTHILAYGGAEHSDGAHGWVDPGGQVGAGTRLWHQAQVSTGARVGADCTLGQ